MARDTTRRLVQGAAIAAAMLILAAGCMPTAHRSLGVDAEDVDHVELFVYEFGTAPETVTRTVLTDPQVIPEMTKAFREMPVSGLSASPHDMAGSPAVGVRFVLKDGSTVEVSQVFIAPHNVVVFWPDGEVHSSPWGMPYDDYYNDLGEVSEVSPSELPATSATHVTR